MDHEVLAVKISHLADSVRRALKDPTARYFDPAVVEEWFARFAVIRHELKAGDGRVFSDLLDRELPKPSGTTDHEGRGYIVREHLEKLKEDCEYSFRLLQLARESREAQPKRVEDILSKRIFVSHSSRDKPLVEFFVEQILRLGLEVPTDDIFCTSLEGMDIRNGEDFRRAIRRAMQGARIVILIVTRNYKASEVCLNEMGAAWASEKRIIPVAVEPIDYKSVGVLMEPRQIPKLSSPESLSKLRDDVIQELGLANTKTALWDAKKRTFLEGLSAKIAECKLSPTLPREEVRNLVVQDEDSHTYRDLVGTYSVHKVDGQIIPNTGVTVELAGNWKLATSGWGIDGRWQGSIAMDPQLPVRGQGIYQYLGKVDCGHHEIQIDRTQKLLYVNGKNTSHGKENEFALVWKRIGDLPTKL